MLTPRTANCSSSSSRPPAWSSRWKSTTVVLSAPVGSGSVPGRATRTKRVTADALSPMSSARTSRPSLRAATGAHTPASNMTSPGWPSAAALAAVDSVGTYSASGRCPPSSRAPGPTRASGCRRCGPAASGIPGRAHSTKVIGTSTSPMTTSGSPVASESRVAETPPSTEFSIGTIAASMSPARRADEGGVDRAEGQVLAAVGGVPRVERHLGERAARTEVAEAVQLGRACGAASRRVLRPVGLAGRRAGRLEPGSSLVAEASACCSSGVRVMLDRPPTMPLAYVRDSPRAWIELRTMPSPRSSTIAAENDRRPPMSPNAS